VVTFNVEVAVPPAVSVTGVELNVKVGQTTGAEQLAAGIMPLRATEPARPPRLVKVIVERPKVAWGIVNDRGLAETAKLQTLTVTLATAPRYVLPMDGEGLRDEPSRKTV
jgi:hypothetical protein